jgi:hypothetical protein
MRTLFTTFFYMNGRVEISYGCVGAEFIAQIERFIDHFEGFIAQSGDLSLKHVSQPSSLIETTTSTQKNSHKSFARFLQSKNF